jgi:acetolactate synthase I/II/III large subunit
MNKTINTIDLSDARKGFGFVLDFQPLTAWDEAERKRRM